MSAPHASARGPGRPREFEIEDALDAAVRVFRERGYHATSIGDLAAAMRLAAGSIYKAFRDKRAIFLAAFDHYKAGRDAALRTRLATAATGRDRVRAILAQYASLSSGVEGRRGCLVVGTAAELATFDPEVAARVATALNRTEALLAEAIAHGQSDGSVARTLDTATTARLLLCVLQGMRVLGKTGRTRAQMQAAADVAMKLLN